MRYLKFLKEKALYIFTTLFVVASCEIFLLAYDISPMIKLYIGISPIVALITCITIEYYHKKQFYDLLKQTLSSLDVKYLANEIIANPNFSEGQIVKEALDDIGKSMLENVNEYKYMLNDYKEYIELWIHEIKLPISASKLIIENNKSDATLSIAEELEQIEDYIERALFYARSNTVEKDYLVKKCPLQNIINQVVIKNKRLLISNKILVDVHDIDLDVYTDSKWVCFIINQIMQNSIKYMSSSNKKIEIYAEDNNENTTLYIKDTGIGIKASDISRIFEKGFTGTNGRIDGQKSTGIGLYLCNKLCNKLGLGIFASSKEDVGTTIKITFPKSSFITLTKV